MGERGERGKRNKKGRNKGQGPPSLKLQWMRGEEHEA